MSLFDKWTGRVSGFLDDVLLPDDLRTTLKRAQKALRDEEHAEALRLLDLIEAARPGLGRVAELRGLALLGLERWPEASEALRRAATQRAAPRTLRYLSLALEGAGDHRAARDVLREALHHDPAPEERFDIHRALARLHKAMNRGDKATRELRKALRVAQQAPPDELPLREAASALAEALQDEGDPAQARQVLEEVFGDALRPPLALEGMEDSTLRALARLFLHERQPQLALDCRQALLARHPEEPQAMLELGRAALESQQAQRALEALQGAAALDPALPGLHTLLGRAQLALGQPQEALLHLEEARKRDGRDSQARLASAWATLELARQQEQPEQARTLATSAEDMFHAARSHLSGGEAEVLHGIGASRWLRGDAMGARRILRAAVDEGAGPRAWLALAQAQLDSAGAADAVATLGQLLQHPDGHDGELGASGRALLERAQQALAAPLPLPAPGARDLRALTVGLQAMQEHIAQAPRLHALLPQAQQALRALDTPLEIAVVGEFNAGKSTLVNAILGEEVVPMGVLPTTAHIQVMRYGPRRVAQLHRKDGSVEEVSFKDVKRAVKRDDRARTIDHIEYLYPHPDLRRVHIWDTPGFNALDPDHEKHAQDALARAQAILWLLDANQALSDSEWQLLDKIPAARERLVVVLNKVDSLGQGESRQQALEQVLGHVRPPLEGRCLGLLHLSGLEGLKARRDEDQALLESSGMAALELFLRDEVFDRAARFKAVDADRALGQLCREVQALSQQLQAALEGRQEHLRGLYQGIDVEESNLTRQALPHARQRLADGLDVLISILAREVEEAMHPGAGLVDALLTRMELDQEDVSFVLRLMQERFEDLLSRSRDRILSAALEAEQRLADGADALIAAAPPQDASALQSRLRVWLDQARQHRLALEQQTYVRWRAFTAGRTTAPGAHDLVRRAARRDIQPEARRDALRSLLPEVDAALVAGLQTWIQEYFAAARRFCDTLRGDLQIMAIEARALRSGLELRQTDQTDRAQDAPDT